MWYYSSETEHFFFPMVRNTDSQILIMEKKDIRDKSISSEISLVRLHLYVVNTKENSKEMKTPH